MSDQVSYECRAGVAAITMDDGRSNAMSLAMLADLNAALDRAESDRAVVLLGGREGVFCTGFELTQLRAGGAGAQAMVRGGFELTHRLLSFPTPVVVACTGHAVAFGAFLLCSGDYRVGAAGSFRYLVNEVSVGITVPWSGLEIMRQRLTPAALNRVLCLAESFDPAAAVEAGLLDAVAPAEDVVRVARRMADNLADLDLDAHAATKLRLRRSVLAALRTSIDATSD